MYKFIWPRIGYGRTQPQDFHACCWGSRRCLYPTSPILLLLLCLGELTAISMAIKKEAGNITRSPSAPCWRIKVKEAKTRWEVKNIKERAGIQRGCTRICSSHQKRWKWTIRSDVSSWYKGVTSHQKETEKRGLNNYFCHYSGQSPRLSELQSRCHLKTPCSLKSEGMCEASMACENQCN